MRASPEYVRHVKEIRDFVLDPPVFFDFKELSYQQDNLSTLYLTPGHSPLELLRFRQDGVDQLLVVLAAGSVLRQRRP